MVNMVRRRELLQHFSPFFFIPRSNLYSGYTVDEASSLIELRNQTEPARRSVRMMNDRCRTWPKFIRPSSRRSRIFPILERVSMMQLREIFSISSGNMRETLPDISPIPFSCHRSNAHYTVAITKLFSRVNARKKREHERTEPWKRVFL